MTPEQLDTLRSGLTAVGHQPSQLALIECYVDFYGLDFSSRFPSLTYQLGSVESSGYSLAVHQWTQPEATCNLLLVHGYFDHTGIFGKLVEWAVSQNCNVLIFDLPGHGLSTGEQASITDFKHYAQAIDDVLRAVKLPDLPLLAMGQSTGGAALVEYARHFTWPFAATVLLAPLIRPMGWNKINIAQRVVRVFTKRIPRNFATNSSDSDFLAFLKTEPLQSQHTSLRWVDALRNWLSDLAFEDLGVGPALIVQGDNDGTVDWQYNLPKLAQLFPESTIENVSGAGHQLANESQALRDHYLAKVEHYLAERGLPLGGKA
ncbi:MAG: alpha/beta hydrolase [Halioglobus sp.]